ncbi:hypothetical protein [Halovenus salina]|uniref:Uncharacterized protein n=1 Tax=Halovenus salina TaxID=1510225 RepID=A0ABD5VWN7_9EURY
MRYTARTRTSSPDDHVANRNRVGVCTDVRNRADVVSAWNDRGVLSINAIKVNTVRSNPYVIGVNQYLVGSKFGQR